MAEHVVTFDVASGPVAVPTGALLTEAARLAGVEISQPCGGQGRCGRCLVQIANGGVRRRSTLRLTQADVQQGFALACQAVVEGNATILVPPQEKVERRLSTDRTAAKVTVPVGYDYGRHQTVRRIPLTLNPPSMTDQTDDWSRLQLALRQQAGLNDVHTSLAVLKKIGPTLRQSDWQVTAVLDTIPPPIPPSPHPGLLENPRLSAPSAFYSPRLIDVYAGHAALDAPLWGAAVDIGTTTVTVWLVDLVSGEAQAQAAEYNGQIERGEDVISRIIYASKNNGRAEGLRRLVLDTINGLLETVCQRVKRENLASFAPLREPSPAEIMKVSVVGNSTMMHLFLGIPAASIRLSPFVTAVNSPPLLRAQEVGLCIHPEATVDCLPGVASYVGADITAGVLSSGLDDSDQVSLFLDIGTNGETALGSREWLVSCACSAGPAFEGAGVVHGMRATRGAIEEVWINSQSYEPTCRVIGGGRPRGLCGSGLLSLIAELFVNGLLDRAGHFDPTRPTGRIRSGEHGLEYVVAWASETQHGRDVVLTAVDVDNLLRAKAAIYAGFTVLADSVGFPLETVDRVLIGGAFGQYINVEKAVEIGLLPDLPWERFHFLGNTAVKGAYLALLDHQARARIEAIARRMTYVELSADNTFYDAFTSALFLPHTDSGRFPSFTPSLALLLAGGGNSPLPPRERG
ncbi:MAG: ASKHA domain-containing protein [Chloroflexota bacterium]